MNKPRASNVSLSHLTNVPILLPPLSLAFSLSLFSATIVSVALLSLSGRWSQQRLIGKPWTPDSWKMSSTSTSTHLSGLISMLPKNLLMMKLGSADLVSFFDVGFQTLKLKFGWILVAFEFFFFEFDWFFFVADCKHPKTVEDFLISTPNSKVSFFFFWISGFWFLFCLVAKKVWKKDRESCLSFLLLAHSTDSAAACDTIWVQNFVFCGFLSFLVCRESAGKEKKNYWFCLLWLLPCSYLAKKCEKWKEN